MQDEADRAFSMGRAAQLEDRLDEARRNYDRALKRVPGHAATTKAIKELLLKAQRDFNHDRAAYRKGVMKQDAVLKKFKATLAFLRKEDGPIYKLYDDAVWRLERDGEF